ncbi:unnamed protein product [Spirodela intermedia]|uniref:Uncharacterized protein n=1 Tax=Spirodela intermedia TaxID=51605 RepID=A0A7I8JC09_SPIIN|nr:unnamed protein product [Spirodela intermedia]CAA6667649.1 unnamed protein product [Spirodela intermedia]
MIDYSILNKKIELIWKRPRSIFNFSLFRAPIRAPSFSLCSQLIFASVGFLISIFY